LCGVCVCVWCVSVCVCGVCVCVCVCGCMCVWCVVVCVWCVCVCVRRLVEDWFRSMDFALHDELRGVWCVTINLPIFVILYNTTGMAHLKVAAFMFRVESTGNMLPRSSCGMGDNYQRFGRHCGRQFRGRQIEFLRKFVNHLYITTVHNQADDNLTL